MDRYLTTTDDNRTIRAYRNPNKETALNAIDNAEDWIFHFAVNCDTAKAQHDAKLDLWRADVDAGRKIKQTY